MYRIIDINLIYIKFLQYLGNLFKEYKQFFFKYKQRRKNEVSFEI